MRCLVTGAAGFIGSQVSRTLLAEGWQVRGVDNFADFYPRPLKERNIADLAENDSFELREEDLVTTDMDKLISGTDAVIHLAAQAGVRTSWGSEFRTYSDTNILATQRLLEGCRKAGTGRVVYASSSSLYGETQELPLREDAPLKPLSPYGVTKMAAEKLCRLYWKNFGVPTVSLRYFTVYGPGQRPDMSFTRFIRAIVEGGTFTVFGTGEQTRDFTFVEDAARVTVDALAAGSPGEAYNIGGGNHVTLNNVIALMEKTAGARARFERTPFEKGDMMHTMADTTRARKDLGYAPRTTIAEGIAAQVAWVKSLP